MAGWSEQNIDLGGLKLTVGRGGSGRPVLVLHHDIGTLDKLPFYEALSAKFDVIVPIHPGFGDKSERAQWLRHPRDIAALYQWLLAELGIERASLVGLGFGGWIAAEMAALAPRDFHRIVLVGAMGVKPPEGDIKDQAIVSYIDYAQAGFHDPKAFERNYGEVSTDQLVDWDLCREMSFRIAWKPYMYSPTLPHLLGGVQVAGPRRLGRRRPDRAAQRRRALCQIAAQRAVGDRRRVGALRRHGTARRARPPRHQLRRRELAERGRLARSSGLTGGRDGRGPIHALEAQRRPPCM